MTQKQAVECLEKLFFMDKEIAEAVKIAIKALENPTIEIDGRLFILEKPVLKSIDCYNLWNVYGFREVEK